MTTASKAAMRQVKVLLAVLVPVLWLAGTTACQGATRTRSSGQHSAGALAGSHHQDTAATGGSLEQTARRWVRRVQIQPGLERFQGPATFAQFEFPTRTGTTFSADSPCVRLSLAQCWQFRWRTALEPRAPSSPGA